MHLKIECFIAIACDDDNDGGDDVTIPQRELELVANSNMQWAGVAVSQNERIFANFPNWSDAHTLSVVEVTDTSNVTPYPNAAWNT